jgi:uncharacterized protein (TIGR00661 family)
LSKNFNKHILVAPLDWGLGHATRCIPVIRILIQKGCHVLLAADGAGEKLLKTEFPQLQTIKLKGYGVNYAKKWVFLKLISQLFKIKAAIKYEHAWLKQVVIDHKIDLIISDNRYGLYHTTVPSVIITHQLRVLLPGYIRWAEGFLQNKIYGFINKFSQCWVPDTIENNISGLLGHPQTMPAIPVNYIGWLSRFIAQPQPIIYNAAIILSGPEPQRTIMENIILQQINTSQLCCVLVRGLPTSTQSISSPNKNLVIHNHLAASQLQQVFQQARFIISRSGYSTLMDAFTLNKKCIFIPTPGQTEQLYLAQLLAQNKAAVIAAQNKFNINEMLLKASEFEYNLPPVPNNNLLITAIEKILDEQ